MQVKFALLFLAAMFATSMPNVKAAAGDRLIATRVVHTIINQSPFLVDSTTTVTWTQGSSISDSTTAATPTVSVGAR